MRRLLLSAASVAATTTVSAAIPAEAAIDTAKLTGTTDAGFSIRHTNNSEGRC